MPYEPGDPMIVLAPDPQRARMIVQQNMSEATSVEEFIRISSGAARMSQEDGEPN